MTLAGSPPLLLTSEATEAYNSGTEAASLARTLNVIIACSSFCEEYTKQYFAPRIETRYFDGRNFENGGDVFGTELWLDRSLTTLTSVTNGDDVPVTSYTLYPRGASFYNTINLPRSGSVAWAVGTDDYANIPVAGIWHHGGQWVSTGLTCSDATISATSITASGSTIPAGAILKIGTEYLYCESGASASLTVSRAYLGSTASAISGTPIIYRWQSHPLVMQAMKRLVGWMLEQYKAPLFGTVTILGTEIPIVADVVPKDILLLLRKVSLPQRIGRV